MKNLLLTLFMALAVMVFVMVSTQLFRIFSLLSNGFSPWLFFKLVAYTIPDALRYALPLSVMISSVLVFSRMSADNEIVALKASGIGMWQIVAPGLAMSALISVFALYLVHYLTPEARFALEQIKEEVAEGENILAVLEPGKVIGFPKKNPEHLLRVGRIEGRELFDVHFFMMKSQKEKSNSDEALKGKNKSDKDQKNKKNSDESSKAENKLNKNEESKVGSDIIAEKGVLQINPETGEMEIVLYNFIISQLPGYDKKKLDRDLKTVDESTKWFSGSEMTIPIPFQNLVKKKQSFVRKYKYMNINMLLGELLLQEKNGMDDEKKTTECWAEIQSRFALALSPFALFLIGIPFGIRSRRNETSVGLLICAILGIFFYVFQLIARKYDDNPLMFPQYIVWIPVVLYQIIGILAIHNIAKK